MKRKLTRHTPLNEEGIIDHIESLLDVVDAVFFKDEIAAKDYQVETDKYKIVITAVKC